MSECNPPFRPDSTAIRPTMKNGGKQLLDESGIGTSSTALPNPDDTTHLATRQSFLGPRNPRHENSLAVAPSTPPDRVWNEVDPGFRPP